jgi:glycosyltransferase involved in cell wall biosynthesis
VTDPEQISALYYEHDIVCVPSLQEGLGLVNAEALAHGTAVVSTNTGGIPEVLNNGNYGYLVNASDPSALSEAILECVSAAATTAEKTQKGRDFVLERFGLDRMLSELNKIFEEVAQQHAVSNQP